MNYESWVAEVPQKLKFDLIWKFPAYAKCDEIIALLTLAIKNTVNPKYKCPH